MGQISNQVWVVEMLCHGEETTNGTGQRTAPPLSLAIGEAGCFVRQNCPRNDDQSYAASLFSNCSHSDRNVNEFLLEV